MSVEELIKEGQLKPAIAEAEAQIRRQPANAKLRILLFNLLCVIGDWKRALTQLETAAQMDVENELLKTVYKPAISAELLRRQIFSGQATPLIFGEPQPWMGKLIQSLQLTIQGQFEAADQLHDMAMEEASSSSGTVNGEPFQWIADGDTRLGPMLEALVNSQFYWIPFGHIQKIQVDVPTCIRDTIWTTATFVWSNGGTAVGLIPTRYCDSENSQDSFCQLSRKTDWIEKPENNFYGIGQRTLITEKMEYPLMEIREITFSS